MEYIEEFYKNKTKEILYLELKNASSKYDFPLPILKEDFVDEIGSGTFEEEIEFKYFFRGMIYNISVDTNFKYAKNYLNILTKDIPNLDEVVLREALKEIPMNVRTANVFLKFNYDNYKNIESNYYYASTLLNIYSENEKQIFIEEAEKVLNKNLNIDGEYSLTYLLLGDIERYKNNLIKANLYYKKSKEYLKQVELNENILKEINYRIQSIDEEALYSEVKDMLNYSKYYEVIKKLDKLEQEDYRKYYYLGNAYLGLTQYEKALESYKRADKYENKSKSREFYIDYSYFLAEIGKVKKALLIIEQGLKIYEDNESLLFNRSLIYINTGEIEKAREDLTTIVQYYDISEEIFNNSMILLEKIQNL